MKKENVVVKKDCHSRGMLSGIYNACRCHKKKKTLLNGYVEDPRLQISGMTPLFNNGGFTLIELLVVVLIIGILAAVAVPQYQKAVAKSRFATIKAAGEALRQAEEVYYLANGAYTGNFEKLDISLPSIEDITATEEISSIKIATGQSCSIRNDGHFACTTSIPGQGTITYETNGIHYPSPYAGERMCVVKDTDETSFRNKFCKAETGATNYAYKDTSEGYMGWIYQ